MMFRSSFNLYVVLLLSLASTYIHAAKIDYLDDFPVGYCGTGKKYTNNSSAALKHIVNKYNDGDLLRKEKYEARKEARLERFKNEDTYDAGVIYNHYLATMEPRQRKSKPRGEAVIAIPVRRSGKLRAVQEDLSDCVKDTFRCEDTLETFKHFHVSLLHTGLFSKDAVVRIDSTVAATVEAFKNHLATASIPALTVQVGGAAKLFGPTFGKKFIGIPATLDDGVHGLTTSLVTDCFPGGRVVPSYHVSVGCLLIDNLHDARLLDNLIDSRALVCEGFECKLNEVILLHGESDTAITYQCAPSESK
jgi:hypothetical protein